MIHSLFNLQPFSEPVQGFSVPVEGSPAFFSCRSNVGGDAGGRVTHDVEVNGPLRAASSWHSSEV